MKIPAEVALTLARGVDPAKGGLVERLQFGHVVPMASANRGVAYDSPRHPGRVPTGRLGNAPGAFSPPATRAGYALVVGPTAIPGNSAERVRRSVEVLGVAGTRMSFPRAFGQPGSEAPRLGSRNTPARTIIETAELYTGKDGEYAPLRSDVPAPATPATPPTTLTPGRTVRTAMPIASGYSAPMIVDTPVSAGGETTFVTPSVFQSGGTCACGPYAPPAEYRPTGAPGDTGALRMCEGPKAVAAVSGSCGGSCGGGCGGSCGCGGGGGVGRVLAVAAGLWLAARLARKVR